MRIHLAVPISMVLALASGWALAQQSLSEFTEKITAELEQESPEAARFFDQANEARDRSDFEEAEHFYRRTLELAPGFHHAKRRLAYIVLWQDRREEALRLTEQALAAEKSPENSAARIAALVRTDKPSKAQIKEALAMADWLLSVELLDWQLIIPICDAAIADQNQLLLHLCVGRLEKAAPEEIVTQLYGWTLAVGDGNLELARAKVETARQLGLDEATQNELLALTESARPPTERLLSLSWKVGAVWLGGLLVLLGLGFALSRVTTKAASLVASAPSGEPVGLSNTLRKLYRGVLWATCSYYFLSLPIVVLAVIGLGVAAIRWILTLELIPLKLVVLIVGVVGVTVIAVVRSLFIRPQETDPGVILDLEKQPGLRGVLDEVAKEIDTRPVDNVYLTPFTELAVMERGGVFRQLRGMSERCLILGVGVLDDMKLGSFKAILGHEYGHFSNRDTAGGGFALAVTRSLHLTAVGLAEGGAAVWYNPTWLFLIAFSWIFMVVSQGASRLQEILADRWAVLAYGAEQFESGLRHVIERSVRFGARAGAILAPMYESEVVKVSPNFYAAAPEAPVPEAEIEEAIEKQINAETSLADSHPSPAQRFGFVRSQTRQPTGDLSDSEEDVWSLFVDREEVERSMSREIWRSTGMVSDGDLEAAYA